MELTFKEQIIRAYSEGHTIEGMVDNYNTHKEEVMRVIHGFRDEQRMKRKFSDDFRRVLAGRDISGVPRTTIANEMDINVNTVKKACKMFGHEIKGKVTSDKSFTRIDGIFQTDKCVKCESNRYNQVYENTYYCYLCGSEYIHKKDHVLRVNWEYID